MRNASAASWDGLTAAEFQPPVLARLILRITQAFVAIGVCVFVASRMAGSYRGIQLYFETLGACLLIALPCVGVAFCFHVVKEFSSGEPLRTCWELIGLAAVCELVSSVCVHLVSANLVKNLFDQHVMDSNSPGAALQQFGVALGGPVRFALLAIALAGVLRVYRRSGLLVSLRVWDWILLAAVGFYVALEVRETVLAVRGGLRLTAKMVLNWPNDPLLLVLLAEVLLLYRSARRMRPGMVGKCWEALASGVGLVVLGDSLLWAARSGYLNWPWSAVEWYVWAPAAAACAVAPIYQLAAVRAARTSRVRL